ncbi:putative damage-inducible protein DinB [Lewinella marina]|uniref:Damage-inducible protein DinB n=1 Tax=Neolewinella marina TaxID=438751 RepID=A0A2G0CEK8_9BACT|nr:DinB family protein [Neolewinella marina]NJB87261.1 putative damage-inducible protein DinB [Neolewinella marina]PHK98414.1 damage-inducible protein DinB [Neolewinella marina]
MKNLTLLLLLFAFAPLGAQHSADALVADWERAKAFTLEYLEAMPADQLDLRPTPEIRSFAELMTHIAEANYGFGAPGTAQEMPSKPEDSGMDEDITKESLTQKVSDSYDYVINGIRNLDAQRMGEDVQLFGQFDMDRATALDKAFEHQTHHRGQVSVYLRLAGVTPPGMKLF